MWPNAQETADLVTFFEEILNEKNIEQLTRTGLDIWNSGVAGT